MLNLPHYQPISLARHGGPSGNWILFYGGPFSNFVGGPHLIVYPQPWCGNGTGKTGCVYEAVYETAEHFFQASKASSKYDHEIIRIAPGPGSAKRRGNSRQSWAPGCASLPLLRDDWEDGDVKYEVMLAGLRVKFNELQWRQTLLDTGDHQIAEDSPSDFIWGIRDGNGGFTGQNLLGKALMQVREELRDG